MIIPCDYCPLHWHMDCLDPPMTHFYPRKGTQMQDFGDWMCPVHVDHDLEGTDPSHRLYARDNLVGSNPYSRTRTTKVRKPKQAKIVDVGMTGDSRNRGLIEIANDPTDDEAPPLYERECGATLRIPEKRIKLDFIDRVHRYVRRKD